MFLNKNDGSLSFKENSFDIVITRCYEYTIIIESFVSRGAVVKDIEKDPFEQYIKNLPPSRRELGQAWSAAIGLQDVDGIKPSEYLYDTAKRA